MSPIQLSYAEAYLNIIPRHGRFERISTSRTSSTDGKAKTQRMNKKTATLPNHRETENVRARWEDATHKMCRAV